MERGEGRLHFPTEVMGFKSHASPTALGKRQAGEIESIAHEPGCPRGAGGRDIVGIADQGGSRRGIPPELFDFRDAAIEHAAIKIPPAFARTQ
jgi:hypothetical protein